MNYGYEAKNNSTDMRNGGTIYLSRSNTLPENGIFMRPMKNISLTVKHHTRSRLRVTVSCFEYCFSFYISLRRDFSAHVMLRHCSRVLRPSKSFSIFHHILFLEGS